MHRHAQLLHQRRVIGAALGDFGVRAAKQVAGKALRGLHGAKLPTRRSIGDDIVRAHALDGIRDRRGGHAAAILAHGGQQVFNRLIVHQWARAIVHQHDIAVLLQTRQAGSHGFLPVCPAVGNAIDV